MEDNLLHMLLVDFFLSISISPYTMSNISYLFDIEFPAHTDIWRFENIFEILLLQKYDYL